MHHPKLILLGAALLCAASQTVFAQGPGGNRGIDANGNPPLRRQPPVSPLMKALDANGDGELSAEEIANAPAALKALDKNGDGKLDQNELRPAFGSFPGGPGGGGFGGPGGFGDFGGGPGGMRGRESQMTAEQEVSRYMSLDKNGDGKLTKDEVPERMQGLFTRADADKDGVITKAEIEQMVAKARAARQSGGPEGFGGPPPEMMMGNPPAQTVPQGETRDAAGSPAPSAAPSAKP